MEKYEAQWPLETVFSVGNQFHDRILYDYSAGSYYDRYSDVYITLEQAQCFGLPK